MKRFISAALCAAFTFTLAGCAGQSADSTPATAAAASTEPQMGRWVETAVDMGSEQLVSHPTQLADGTIVLYTAAVGETGIDSYTRRTSTDGGQTWTAEPASFDIPDTVNNISLAADGTMALAAFSDSEDGYKLSLYLQAPGSEPTAIEDDSIAAYYPNSVQFIGDTLAYLSDNDGGISLVKIDPANLNVTTVPLPTEMANNTVTFSQAGDQLIYMGYDNNTADMILSSLDPNTGNATELLNPAPKATSTQGITGDADGAVYYSGEDGIYRLAPGGTLPEQVVPANGTALSIASNYPMALLHTTEGGFLVEVFGDSGSSPQLYAYNYDETLPTHADTTLTFWTLSDSTTARTAVNLFKKANPDVDVDFQIALSDEEEDTDTARTDALTQLNTLLLAGEGPDVLLLDDTDYQTYASKGMLADMADALPMSDLQSNLVTPFVTDGKVYVLPARFSVPALCGDTGTLDGLTDLAAMQQAVLDAAPRPDLASYSDEYYTALPDEGKYALRLTSGSDYAEFILPTSANAILHDNVLDADALTEVFTFVQTTADYYGIKNYTNNDPGGVTAQSYENSDMILIMPTQDEYSTASHAKYGWLDAETPYAVIAMARTTDILDSNAQAIPVDMIPLPGLATGAYTPKVLVGVNANSQHLDAAKQLAATFFSTDVQSQYCSDGTTVRADCLQEKLDAVKASVANSKPGKVNGAYTGDLDAFYAQCTTPVTVPALLKTSFADHAQKLIDGSEDVAAATAGVQADLSLYLAEQQ